MSPAPQDLLGRHLVVGLSGGIACYKTAELVRLLKKAGASVQVVMTKAATQFITPLTLQALSQQTVHTDPWDASEPQHMIHIALTRQADAILIAPASADILAKLAQGLTDDLLSLLCLARPRASCPLLVAPAMNQAMWSHPATQRNLAQLKQDGTTLLGPAQGEQACGEWGEGRMLEPDQIVADMVTFFTPKVLANQRVLITAGPTFEPIDPVRGLTNLSSGKMGFAIAQAANEAGAQVTLVAGPVHLPTPRTITRIDVQTAEQMHQSVMAQAPMADIFIATAAVADWRTTQTNQQKIKKPGDGSCPALTLQENPDILAQVAALPKAPYCVGFAAETEHLIAHARAKLQRKRIPLIVANCGPTTFGRDDNTLVLIDAHTEQHLPLAPKISLARTLIQSLAQRLKK